MPMSGQMMPEQRLVVPERRNTVTGECLGCLTQFAIDARLPLPATCSDCGADVLARADIEGPPPPRPSFNAMRIRRAQQ